LHKVAPLKLVKSYDIVVSEYFDHYSQA